MNERPNVELMLNSFAFKGNDLDEILQNSDVEFQSNYYPRISFQHHPAAVSEMFISLVVNFAGPLGLIVASGFLNEVGKDIYTWLKSFKTIVTKKEYKQESNIEIVFKDVRISSFQENHEEFISLFNDLEGIVKKVEVLKKQGESLEVSLFFVEDEGWKIEIINRE